MKKEFVSNVYFYCSEPLKNIKEAQFAVRLNKIMLSQILIHNKTHEARASNLYATSGEALAGWNFDLQHQINSNEEDISNLTEWLNRAQSNKDVLERLVDEMGEDEIDTIGEVNNFQEMIKELKSIMPHLIKMKVTFTLSNENELLDPNFFVLTTQELKHVELIEKDTTHRNLNDQLYPFHYINFTFTHNSKDFKILQRFSGQSAQMPTVIERLIRPPVYQYQLRLDYDLSEEI